MSATQNRLAMASVHSACQLSHRGSTRDSRGPVDSFALVRRELNQNGTDYVGIWLALADQGGAFNFWGCCSWGNQSRLPLV
jgi:hypothetical protein